MLLVKENSQRVLFVNLSSLENMVVTWLQLFSMRDKLSWGCLITYHNKVAFQEL